MDAQMSLSSFSTYRVHGNGIEGIRIPKSDRRGSHAS